jgi:sugar O-acyltransferase (sialic acid O-acetyltransferase NeuD family)
LKKSNELSLIGYSGHAYICAEVALLNGYVIDGYFELTQMASNPFNLNYRGKGVVLDPALTLFVAIGDNALRKKLYNQAYTNGNTISTLIHPKANVSELAEVKSGTLICAGAIINPLAEIGAGVIINSGAIIEHECKIGNFTHVAPGAVLTGNVTVGELCFIGANTVIKQGTTICSNVTIGMGAVVTKNITEPGTYVGAPARKLIK